MASADHADALPPSRSASPHYSTVEQGGRVAGWHIADAAWRAPALGSDSRSQESGAPLALFRVPPPGAAHIC